MSNHYRYMNRTINKIWVKAIEKKNERKNYYRNGIDCVWRLLSILWLLKTIINKFNMPSNVKNVFIAWTYRNIVWHRRLLIYVYRKLCVLYMVFFFFFLVLLLFLYSVSFASPIEPNFSFSFSISFLSGIENMDGKIFIINLILL